MILSHTKTTVSLLRNHMIFWVIFILYEVGISVTFNGRMANIFDYAAHFALNISLFYLFSQVLTYALKQRQQIRFPLLGLLIILIIPCYLSVKYLIQLILQASGVVMFRPFKDLYTYTIESIWRAFYFMMLSSGYWFARSVVMQKGQIADLENQNLRAQLDKQVLENAYLQSQINPHFLFNTLNFLYISINRVSEKVSESIMLLAAVMRYSLEGPGKDGKTALADELEQIQNFIELNQARFDNQLHIDFRVEGDASELRFIPLALLTFIENVFKYADLRDAANPAIIRLAIRENELNLMINNKILSGGGGNSHGIGMGNVKKRLDIYYKDQYSLKVDATEGDYQLSLQVNC